MGIAESSSVNDLSIQELVSKSREAQSIFESFKQEQVDAIVRDIGKYVFDNAEPLARMAVDETDAPSSNFRARGTLECWPRHSCGTG